MDKCYGVNAFINMFEQLAIQVREGNLDGAMFHLTFTRPGQLDLQISRPLFNPDEPVIDQIERHIMCLKAIARLLEGIEI